MPDVDLFNLLVQLLVLAAAGFVGCYLAERLGTARIVGGLIAGLLIGPSLLGKVAPDAERWLWKGAQTELAQLASLEAEYESAVKASIISGVSEIHREILKEEYEPRIDRARVDILIAEESHAEHTRVLSLFAIVMLLLAAGRNGPFEHPSQQLPSAVAITLGASALPLVGGAVAMWLIGKDAVQESTDAAWLMAWPAALAVIALPISSRLVGSRGTLETPATDTRTVPRIRAAAALSAAAVLVYVCGLEHFVGRIAAHSLDAFVWTSVVTSTVALVAGFAAVLAIVFFGLRLIRHDHNDNPAWPAGLLFIGALVPIAGAVYASVSIALGALAAGLALGACANTPALIRRGFAPLADGLALPILCAYIGTRIDIIPHFDWVWVLIALILFGDGKTTGVVLVGRYVCRLDWRTSMRMGTILAAGGALPLIVALMVFEAGIIDQTLFVALVIANAVTAAFAAPVLRMIDAYFASSEPDGFSDD